MRSMVGRAPPDAVVSGWKRDSDDPSPVQQAQGFPVWAVSPWAALTQQASVVGRLGSNVYEVNPWLWKLGRGKPRLGGLSVEAAGQRRHARMAEGRKRGVETRRRCKADQT